MNYGTSISIKTIYGYLKQVAFTNTTINMSI